MVLCSPLLPLHKSGLHQFGGICNYLKFSNGHRFRIREEGSIFWVLGHCRNKLVVRKFVFELWSSSTFCGAAPGLSKWSTELGAGRKSLVKDQRLTTISLGTVMSPQTAPYNGSKATGDGLMAVKQEMDFQVMNSAENTDETSEMGRNSPLNTGNFASLEISSGEAKEVLSEHGEAKSSSAREDVMTAMKARVRTTSSRRVAVIGAGAAGLVAARELVREGHEVVIYEQGEEVGGVWQYDPRVEDDPLGIDPNRSRVHSSMYHSLRTNLPREIMGYLDYPFLPKEEEGRDSRRFPSHREVAMYLKDFEEDYNLRGLVNFGITVDYVGQQDTRWIVKFHKTCEFRKNVQSHEKDRQDGGPQTEVFDAVVVCNGHYAEPRLVSIPGVESWPGVQIHSHNYRFPHPFQDKVVVVIGNGNSAQDITSEIATLAKEVHQCARAWTSADSSIEGQGPQHNIWRHPMVTRACFNGTVEFQDGKSALADIILYSTGYLFSFPFLDTKGYISVDDNRVDPVYKHVFPPALAPALSFVGLPWKVVPFQLMELQSRWIARLLSGKSSLPSESEMLSDIRTLYEELEANMEFPKSYTHLVYPDQFEYIDWLAEQSGHEPVDTWRKEIYMSAGRNKRAHPDTYRDEIEDQHWYDVAMTSLAQMKSTSKGVSQPSAEQNSYAL